MLRHGITLGMLGASGYDDLAAMRHAQRKLQRYGGVVDGYFWESSCTAYAVTFAGSAVIHDKLVAPPMVSSWLNWMHGPVKKLRGHGYHQKSGTILHESVTKTWRQAVNVLLRRRLGVQIVIHTDGSVTQHADLLAQCSHCGGGRNKGTIGIEAVNRYYGKHAQRGDAVIDAVWAHKRRYILPTQEQMGTLWTVVQWLASERAGVPLAFPAVTGPDFYWGRVKVSPKASGIVAHHRSAHADGLFAEHYLLCRNMGMVHPVAWDTTIAAASCGRRRTAHHRKGG